MQTKLGTIFFPFFAAIGLVITYGVGGEKAIFAVLGAIGGLYLAAFVWIRSDLTLIASYPLLICMPFFLGVSRSPKIFLDQIFIIVLLGIVVLKILVKRDTIQLHLFDLFWPVLCVMMMGLTILYRQSTMVAVRTFFETFGLGMPLCLCLLSAQLATRDMVTKIAKVLCLTILLIAVAGILEVAFKENPVMEYTVKHYGDEYTYMSPEIADATGGQYRPYVVFANPSEAGTVVALCLPFIAALVASNRKWRIFGILVLLIAVTFIGINATRGVWVGLAATSFLFVSHFRRYIMALMPLWILLAILGIIFMSDSNFWERISSFRNFQIRLWYWEQALLYYEGNWLLGMGIGNFSNQFIALGPLSPIPVDFLADVATISTVDNIYLMILVEQGIIGLLGFLFLCLFLLRSVWATYTKLLAKGQKGDAYYAKAALATFTIYLVCGFLADVHLFTKATKLIFMIIGVGWGLGLYEERDEKEHQNLNLAHVPVLSSGK